MTHRPSSGLRQNGQPVVAVHATTGSARVAPIVDARMGKRIGQRIGGPGIGWNDVFPGRQHPIAAVGFAQLRVILAGSRATVFLTRGPACLGKKAMGKASSLPAA